MTVAAASRNYTFFGDLHLAISNYDDRKYDMNQMPIADPEAFRANLYARMGAKRTGTLQGRAESFGYTAPEQAGPPLSAMNPPAAAPAATPRDLYAQPQQPIRTPQQQQMDRERSARALREQARSKYYSDPANFRYGVAKDAAKAAEFNALNQQATAAERLAIDAQRARQTVSQADIASPMSNVREAAAERLSGIYRSRTNLERASANEQQIRDQQAAEAQKVRDEEARIAGIQRQLQDLVVQRQQAALNMDNARVAEINADIASKQAAIEDSNATRDARREAANAAARKVGAEATLTEAQAGLAKSELDFANSEAGKAYRQTRAGLEVDKLNAEINEARAKGELTRAQVVKAKAEADEVIRQETEKLPAPIRESINQLVPEGVDIGKTALGILAGNESGLDMSESDKLAVQSLVPQLERIQAAMTGMNDAQKTEVRNTMLAIMRSLDIGDPSYSGTLWETITNPVAAVTAVVSPNAQGAIDDYQQTRKQIVSILRSIVSGK